MLQIVSITMLQLRLLMKSKGAIASFIGMPLLLTLVLGLIVGGGGEGTGSKTTPVAVVDLDNTFASRRLTAALEHDPSLMVTRANATQVDRLFNDKKIVSGLTIPAGFQQALEAGTTPELRVFNTPGGNVQLAFTPVVSRVSGQVAADYRLARAKVATPGDEAALAKALDQVQSDRKTLGATVTVETLQRAARKPMDGTSPGEAALGFTVMFVMMLVFMQGGTILQERQRGTWGRLLVTPTSRTRLVAGYLIGFFVIGLVQFGVLAGLNHLLFRTNWGPTIPLVTVASVFILCSGGLGFFLAGIVRTAEQQRTMGIIIVSATSMLGGVYWPLDLVSPVMQRIGYLTPQAWAMAAFREVMLRGGAWGALAWPITVLLGFALIFMAAGVFRVRFE